MDAQNLTFYAVCFTSAVEKYFQFSNIPSRICLSFLRTPHGILTLLSIFKERPCFQKYIMYIIPVFLLQQVWLYILQHLYFITTNIISHSSTWLINAAPRRAEPEQINYENEMMSDKLQHENREARRQVCEYLQQTRGFCAVSFAVIIDGVLILRSVETVYIVHHFLRLY